MIDASPVTALRGVGERLAERLRALGVETTQDLLFLLPVRYEDIVDRQQESVRRMLDFIGAPFDPSCLQFQENRRYARTASYAQVTERLYDSSRYRYRHYLKELEPVIPILEPLIGSRNPGYDMSQFTWIGALTKDVGLCLAWGASPFKTIEDVHDHVMVVAGTGAGSETDTWPVIINEALGLQQAVDDLNSDGVVNVADVQIVINAALRLGCTG